MNDMDLLSSFGLATNPLGFWFILLSLLVLFFAWRILLWTSRCFREMEKTNARLDRLIELAGVGLPGEVKPPLGKPPAGIGEGSAGDQEQAPPAVTAEDERLASEPGSGEPAVQPPAARAPETVPLPADPKRPETRLARCEGCGHKLAYKEILAGKRVKCPSCGKVLTLP